MQPIKVKTDVTVLNFITEDGKEETAVIKGRMNLIEAMPGIKKKFGNVVFTSYECEEKTLCITPEEFIEMAHVWQGQKYVIKRRLYCTIITTLSKGGDTIEHIEIGRLTPIDIFNKYSNITNIEYCKKDMYITMSEFLEKAIIL